MGGGEGGNGRGERRGVRGMRLLPVLCTLLAALLRTDVTDGGVPSGHTLHLLHLPVSHSKEIPGHGRDGRIGRWGWGWGWRRGWGWGSVGQGQSSGHS